MTRRLPPRLIAEPPQPLSPSFEAVRLKLRRIASRHEHLKITFQELNSQIRAGFIEFEAVFQSLAAPLMKLVGLKVNEMAAEGRYTSVHRTFSPHSDKDYISRAITAGSDLRERQKEQLTQLVSILKSIQAQVNANHNRISETLTDQKVLIKKYFLKAFQCVAAIHHSEKGSDLSHVMLKLLKVVFNQVGSALNSAEDEMDELIHELAKQFRGPMMEYVKELKNDLEKGSSLRLLDVVKDMEEEMMVRNMELEAANNNLKLSEQSRFQCLSRLKQLEEHARERVSTDLSRLGHSEVSDNYSLRQKGVVTKRQRCQVEESPLRSYEQIPGEATLNEMLSSTWAFSSPMHQPITHSQSRALDRKSPFTDSFRFLLASPSASGREILCSKRSTP